MTTYTQAELHERSLVQSEAQSLADAAGRSLDAEYKAAHEWDCDLSVLTKGMTGWSQWEQDLLREHTKVKKVLNLMEGWDADVSDLVWYLDVDALDRAKGALEEMRQNGVGTRARADVWFLIQFCEGEIERLARLVESRGDAIA